MTKRKRHRMLIALFLLLGMLTACSSEAPMQVTDSETTEGKVSETTEIALEDILDEDGVQILLEESAVQPRELVAVSESGIQAGYTLRASETTEEALSNFRSRLQAFFDAQEASLQEELNIAFSDESEEARSRRERLVGQFRTSSQELLAQGLKIGRLRILREDVETLRGLIRLTEIERPAVADKNPTEIPDPGLRLQSYSHETWAPYGGTSNVTQQQTNQTFYFNNVSPFSSISTYEHETQVYNKNFANYNNLWSSNLPSAYYDTPFLDSIDNFTVGSAQASSIQVNVQYFTYMALTPGSASTATVRIKGQAGHRFPSWCYSTWCIFADATTGSMAAFTAPSSLSWQY